LIDTTVAALTVNMAVATGWPGNVAVMVDVPTTLPVARPFVIPDIVATPTPTRSGEVHVEAAVLSKVVPSLNVSIAANCWVPLTGIETVAGVTFKPFDVAAFTVKLAGVATRAPKAALTTTGMPTGVTVTPVARPVATPTVAFAALAPLVVQTEVAVLSKVVPSLNVSIAANCCVPLTGIEADEGVTFRPFDVAAFTVKLAGVATRAPKAALTTTGVPAGVTITPVARPVATPTVAFTALAPLVVQTEVAVLSKVVPSLNVSIAANCWVPLTGIEAVAGVTFIPLDVAAFTVKLAGVATRTP
jgi:23S rRNA A1618 N6-methylase RlmF